MIYLYISEITQVHHGKDGRHQQGLLHGKAWGHENGNPHFHHTPSDHGIRTPVLRTMQGVMPHPSHRVVTDDIGWGLCVGCPQKQMDLKMARTNHFDLKITDRKK